MKDEQQSGLPVLTTQARRAIESGIPEDELFTPILKSTGLRIVLRIDAGTLNAITRGPGYKGLVRDQLTGIRYHVYGRACSLPNCYCDAEVSVQFPVNPQAPDLGAQGGQ